MNSISLSLSLSLMSPSSLNLHSQRAPLQEAKCQAPAAVSPAQDGSLVESHPYVTDSAKHSERSLTGYSNSTKATASSHCLSAACLSSPSVSWSKERFVLFFGVS